MTYVIQFLFFGLSVPAKTGNAIIADYDGGNMVGEYGGARMIRAAETAGMDNDRLDELIHEVGSNVGGELGAWRFEVMEILMFCITDELHDRIRVFTPIANVEDTSADVLGKCLAANFDRALDARYCIHDGTIWGAFLHPFSSVSEELFMSALKQVSEVARTFGGTFSSGELVFGAP